MWYNVKTWDMVGGGQLQSYRFVTITDSFDNMTWTKTLVPFSTNTIISQFHYEVLN